MGVVNLRQLFFENGHVEERSEQRREARSEERSEERSRERRARQRAKRSTRGKAKRGEDGERPTYLNLSSWHGRLPTKVGVVNLRQFILENGRFGERSEERSEERIEERSSERRARQRSKRAKRKAKRREEGERPMDLNLSSWHGRLPTKVEW